MNNSDFKIITNALISRIYTDWTSYTFSEAELMHICNVVNYSSVEDRHIADNQSLYPYIKWDKLDKMQAIRIVARNPALLTKIDLKKYKYKTKEIFFLIQNNYKLIFTYFEFDFANLPQEDAYFLFCLGKDEFLQLMDITKYKFGIIETMDIIRAYKYRKDIIEKLNYNELKNYQVTEILMNTGDESLELFNLEFLSTLNWLDLLSQQPDFIYRCDFEKFTNGDPFNLVQLVVLFDKPDLSYLINQIDIDDITAFGWEKLLIARPDKFVSLCDFSKLNENHWIEIGMHRPELLIHKQSI